MAKKRCKYCTKNQTDHRPSCPALYSIDMPRPPIAPRPRTEAEFAHAMNLALAIESGWDQNNARREESRSKKFNSAINTSTNHT